MFQVTGWAGLLPQPPVVLHVGRTQSLIANNVVDRNGGRGLDRAPSENVGRWVRGQPPYHECLEGNKKSSFITPLLVY